MKWGKMGLHYGLLVNMEGSHCSQGLIWAHDPNNQGWVIIPSHECEFCQLGVIVFLLVSLAEEVFFYFRDIVSMPSFV